MERTAMLLISRKMLNLRMGVRGTGEVVSALALDASRIGPDLMTYTPPDVVRASANDTLRHTSLQVYRHRCDRRARKYVVCIVFNVRSCAP